MTLLMSLALAASLDKAQGWVQDGKPARAAKVATKQLEKGVDTVEDEDAWREVLADATVALLREEPDLVRAQWFLMEFPRHPDAAEIREMEASLALRQAEAFGSEAVWLGLGRQYAGAPSGKEARRRAEQAHYEGLENSPRGLRSFLVRYPRGVHADEVRERELESAMAWADSEGTAEAWRAVVEGYPDHPELETIRERYRQAALAELRRGGATPEQLWRFAAEFPRSDEGRQAGREGLETAPLRVRVDADRLVLDFGAPPPSGFDLRVEVFVNGIHWEDAAPTMSLGLPSFEPQPSELSRNGAVLSWVPALPLCLVEPGDVSARVTLSQDGEAVGVREEALELEAACAGARRMVFSRLEDDLEGPIAVLDYDPSAQAWAVRPTGWSIPEEWECSHVTEIDAQGVTVSCGEREVKAGWDGRTLWGRETPPDLRRTERADVEVLDESLPLAVSGRGARRALKDPSARTLATVGEREVIVTVASIDDAFLPAGGTTGAPPIPADREKPMPGGPPLPEGAVGSNACPRMSTIDAGLFGNAGGQAVVLRDPDSEWEQVLMLGAGAGGWTCFEWEGHVYSRSVGAGGVLVTLRQGEGGLWVVDTTTVP